MVTLKQIYTVFGHDPKWKRLAMASTQPMVSVFLRKLGDKDISTLTDFDIALQLAMSDQPQERKAKAHSCMYHLMLWAREQGKPFPDVEPLAATTPEVAPEPPKPKVEPKPKSIKVTPPKVKVVPKAPQPKPAEPVTAKHPTRGQHQTKPTVSDADTLDCEAWLADTRPRRGTIYHDTSSKGWKSGHRVFKDCWRAEICIQGVRYRHRAETRVECKEWLRAVTSKKILPTDNKADWWRMEQKKDEAVRIDEIIVSQAEEAVLLYDYHQTGDIAPISDYLVRRLLPHMAYYCAHTLRFGKVRTVTASRQSAALLLTRITAGKPVMNFTATCKRMLRVHKQRGDFFYYEDAPEQVKLMVDGMNLDALAEVWKVTKDRRL